MTVTVARRVLWVALAVILPLPLVLSQSGVIPLLGLLINIWHEPSVLAIIELVAGLALVSAITWLFGHISSPWPQKIRGSILGISLLTMLILFASVPVYSVNADGQITAHTFMTLYQ